MVGLSIIVKEAMVIKNLNGDMQAAFGAQEHWGMLRAVMADPIIYGPLESEVARFVAVAIATDPIRPFISSRQAGAQALDAIGSSWHAQFSRRFPGFPNGAARGVFGMAMWHYLAVHPDEWCFSGVADPYGYGQDSTDYWQPCSKIEMPS